MAAACTRAIFRCLFYGKHEYTLTLFFTDIKEKTACDPDKRVGRGGRISLTAYLAGNYLSRENRGARNHSEPMMMPDKRCRRRKVGILPQGCPYVQTKIDPNANIVKLATKPTPYYRYGESTDRFAQIKPL